MVRVGDRVRVRLGSGLGSFFREACSVPLLATASRTQPGAPELKTRARICCCCTTPMAIELRSDPFSGSARNLKTCRHVACPVFLATRSSRRTCSARVWVARLPPLARR